MKIKLGSNECIRLTHTGEPLANAFVDVRSMPWNSGIEADFYPRVGLEVGNLQIREKAGFIRIFYFEKSEFIKDFDFNFWSDAKIIWSNS